MVDWSMLLLINNTNKYSAYYNVQNSFTDKAIQGFDHTLSPKP
jgi:hypothetical protein